MNSWDCFDTLISRSYKNPISIFDVVSNTINDPFFTKKRISAEKRSTKKTYEDIYRLLPGYDPNIELEIEKKYSFPILENLNRVKDGDIIISDMYMSSDQILDLLRYHGLNKDVQVFVTYSGKHNGYSWNYLKNKHPNVKYHFGDNINSDIKNSRKYGIKSIFCGASLFTPEEESISKIDFTLSCLMRRLRLSNPYFRPKSLYIHDSGSFQNTAGHFWIEEINGCLNYFEMFSVHNDHFILKRFDKNPVFVKIYFDGKSFYSENHPSENNFVKLYNGVWFEDEENYKKEYQRLIWIDQSQFNLPILCVVSKILSKNKKIIFSQRDSLYLYKIFKTMFPMIECSMLDVSRNGYYHPFNQDYINYIIDTTKNSLVVDLHGSGGSANHFFRTHNTELNLYHVCKHPVKKNTLDNNKLTWNHFCERKFLCGGRFLEKYNINNLGPLIGWNQSAIRGNQEHDQVACQTIDESIEDVCKYINLYTIQNSPELIPTLIHKLKNTFTEQFVTTIGP